MVPNIDLRPAAWVPAMPSAIAVRAAIESEEMGAAAAAPKLPAVAVLWKPRA